MTPRRCLAEYELNKTVTAVRITRQNGNLRPASGKSYLRRLKLPSENIARLILAET